MQVTKNEFLEWKSSYVTKQFLEAIQNRIEETKEILAISAGLEPDNDRYLVGMIRAFNEVLDVSVED